MKVRKAMKKVLMDGIAVRRQSWADGMYMFRANISGTSPTGDEYRSTQLAMRYTVDKVMVGQLPDEQDLLADDWEEFTGAHLLEVKPG